MMDIRKLKELAKLMVENDLTELDLRDKDEQATVRRNNSFAPPQVFQQSFSAPATQAHSEAGASKGASKGESKGSNEEAGLIAIESPMVGPFYTASGPDKPALVSVGASVDSETVVCLLEAMKIFNEIKAECSGTVAKVLVKNGQAVEFGQKLFLIRPA
ncbi:MAG: acetyl-CoA carboxylase biotin carboxyl carrier protein [Planctomycetota bacterium]|nr:acetyl-CoA carboxylase biotin carboxyl carrier protein [Planctomycetota bacterium]